MWSKTLSWWTFDFPCWLSLTTSPLVWPLSKVVQYDHSVLLLYSNIICWQRFDILRRIVLVLKQTTYNWQHSSLWGKMLDLILVFHFCHCSLLNLIVFQTGHTKKKTLCLLSQCMRSVTLLQTATSWSHPAKSGTMSGAFDESAIQEETTDSFWEVRQ